MSFDMIDRAHARRPPIKLERPSAGDPCPNPKCAGHYQVAPRRTNSDPDKPPVAVMVCTGCREEVWL